MPRFLLDENLPRSLGAALLATGFDVEDARDVGLRGQSDSLVVAYAKAHGQVIVTRDLGLGNMKLYPLGSHAGVVLMRYPNKTTIKELTNDLVGALRLLQDEDLAGNLVILDPNRLRIRRKP